MKRNKLILAFCLAGCLLSTAIYAQDSLQHKNSIPPLRNEVSILFGHIFSTTDVFYVNDTSFQKSNTESYSPKLGLGYKYHFKKSAIRTKVGIQYWDNSYDNNTNLDHTKGNCSIGSIGYEISHIFGRLTMFYGADIFVRSLKTTGTYTTIQLSDISQLKCSIKSIGINPFIGFAYFFTKNISVSSELFFSFSESMVKKDILYANSQSNSQKDNHQNFDYSPPYNISLNMHF